MTTLRIGIAIVVSLSTQPAGSQQEPLSVPEGKSEGHRP
jgi:hypothetical protein